MHYRLTTDTWGKEEIDQIKKVIKTNIYTYKGKYVRDYERDLAKYFKTKYCVSTNSGSSANLISIAALFFKKKNPLKRGDEVIVPSLAWATTYMPLQQYGLKIKVLDINNSTLNVDFETIKNAISKKTKLIIGVSILGNPIEATHISNLCKKKSIYFMEDNCESMGAKDHNKYCGTFGICNTFSTFFSHHISTIEGGFVLTDNKEIYEILLSLRSHGWTRDIENKKSFLKLTQKNYEEYSFVLPGYNLRPNNIQAAVGISQLKKLKKFIKIRNSNQKYFKKIFKNDDRFLIQNFRKNSSPFCFTLIIKSKYIKLKSKLFNEMRKNKIEFRLITGGSFFKHPVKKYFHYKKFNGSKNVDYLHSNGFFVGNHPKNIFKEIKFLKKILDGVKK